MKARPVWPAALVLGVTALAAALGLGLHGGAAAMPASDDACGFPAADQKRLEAFLDAGCYKAWAHDREIRKTGPIIDGVDYFTHGRALVYYSPQVHRWLLAGRPPGGIPDRAMIVKENYPALEKDGDTLSGWTTMVRLSSGSWDGWFWSSYFPGPDPDSSGQFGYTSCISCHASADNRELTFASLRNIVGEPETYDTPDPTWRIYRAHSDYGREQTPGRLPRPLGAPDQGFLRLFDQVPSVARDRVLRLPDDVLDHAVSGPAGPPRFLTSDQCVGCHDASALQDSVTPNMLVTDRRGGRTNLSPYGEWSASLMGLAGRDPVFHAQLESETALHPEAAGFTENLCYRCHGVMGQRQVHLDRGQPFSHAMVYAVPGDDAATYGALARDGVSCVACHAVAPDGLGTLATFSGQFNVGPPTEVYGPYPDPLTYPMRQALGITPQGGSQVSSSALCGSCHTVILPKVPTAYRGADPAADSAITFDYEQTTYLEWRNSQFQNEIEPFDWAAARTCQQCHMPETFEGKQLKPRIANIEDNTYPPVDGRAPDGEITMQEREPYGRHTLVGINLFVMQMFQQFQSVLGIHESDDMVPTDTTQSLATAGEASLELARAETAKLEIVSLGRAGESLEAVVRLTNLAGHKLPSGVNFRRAFIELTALDADGQVLWGSGQTSPYGVIVDGNGRPLDTEFSRTTWQPHHETIDRQDAVQIYEIRDLDDRGELTTSFLGLFTTTKDNRLLPKGWRTDAPNTDFMQPTGVTDDPRYADGSGTDEVTYRIPRGKGAGPATVQARLYYQSIAPYYLRDRFATASGPETQRLHYIASHLNVKGTPIEGWKLEVASATHHVDR